MRWGRRLPGPILGLLLLGAMTPCASAEPEPYEAIRSLQNLQDRMADGDTIAQAAHGGTIAHIAKAFIAAQPATWADKRNARALIAYLFSGGAASTIGAAIPAGALPLAYRALYVGALAYGGGDDEAAKAGLLPIDARTLPSGLGGHLALLQATLSAPTDVPHAIALLDVARLLEPGTLVEEAALRKEISLIGTSGDLDKFALLTRRYLNAFGPSVYADNFRQLVAQTAMQLGAANTDEAAGRLAKMTAGLEGRERRRLYLIVARDAVIAGRLKMGALASAEASRLAKGSGDDEARAALYGAAATVAGDRTEAAVALLEAVRPARLEAKDRALRASALALAAVIRAPAAVGLETGRVEAGDMTLATVEVALAAADAALRNAGSKETAAKDTGHSDMARRDIVSKETLPKNPPSTDAAANGGVTMDPPP